MVDNDKTPERVKVNLPLDADDHAIIYGRREDDKNSKPKEEIYTAAVNGFSYLKLFLAIVIAAPFATLLALTVIELYPELAVNVGLREMEISEPIEMPDEEPMAVIEPAQDEQDEKDDKIALLLEGLGKTNRELVNTLQKQTEAIIKVAEKEPSVINVAAGASNAEPKTITVDIPKMDPPKVVVTPPKIIVVKVPSRERFDLSYEKQKVLELTGVDLDDPVTGAAQFSKIKSRDALKETIRSLDAIIAASRTNQEVGDFIKSNALSAKKFAGQRLRNLK